MKKRNFSAVLIGIFFILPLLSGCQGTGGQDSLKQASIFSFGGPEVLTSDVFAASVDSSSPKVDLKPVKAPAPVFPIADINFARGGVLATDEKMISDLLSELTDRDSYETVVLLAPTDFQTDQDKIFTYSSGGILGKTGSRLDPQIFQNIKTKAKDLGEIKAGSFWMQDFIGQISDRFFTKASFILISVNKEAGAEQLQNFAAVLRASLPERSLVFAFSDFKDTAIADYQSFQNKFTKSVLSSFDADSFADLPSPNNAPLICLANYLQRLKAARPLKEIEDKNNFAVLYGPGSPEITESPIFLVSFGDIMLGRYVRTLMDKNGLDYPFKKMDDLYLKSNDILLANLEGPIAEKAVSTTKGIAFRFLPDVAPLLKKYHFDVLSLANNHALDMGTQGFDDSFSILQQAGLVPFGDPREINDRSFTRKIVRNNKIAFLGMEEVTFDIDDEKAVAKIKELVAEGYKVIPVIHWGIEYTHSPNQRQQDLAHKFIDAGATAVIAHHPHVVQSYENYNGRPIFYSLGNAVFDQYFSADTQEGLSVAMAISDTEIEIFLMPLHIKQSQLSLMNAEDRQKFLQRFATYGAHSDDEKSALESGHLLLKL